MKTLFLGCSLLITTFSFAQISDFKSINFTKADNIAKLNKGASLTNLPLLAHRLTSKLPNDVERFRAIYTWVCLNIKGDNAQHSKVARFRKKFKNDSIAYLKWNTTFKKTAFQILRKHKKTMCTGYAYLIQELCALANIECKIINGYGRSAAANIEQLELKNHSWNAVKLNNKWYLCDATWSSGYMVADHIFYPDYNDGYFLTEPELFAKTHYPENKKWLLKDKLINTSYVASPLLYGEAYQYKIIPIVPATMKINVAKNEPVVFQFKTLKSLISKKIKLLKYNGTKEYEMPIYNLNINENAIHFNAKFKRKGKYDMHLKIDNDIVATYVVEVLKENF